MTRYVTTVLLLIITTAFAASVAQAGKVPEGCLTFRDASPSEGIPGDSLRSDGLGSYCKFYIFDDVIKAGEKDFHGRGLLIDVDWYEGGSPFADGEIPSVDNIRMFFKSRGIGLMQPGDAPQLANLEMYFSANGRDFGLFVSVVVEVLSDGSLLIKGIEENVGKIREYIGNGRNTRVPVVAEPRVVFQVRVERQ